MSNLVDSVDDTFYYLCRLCALKCSTPGIAIFSDEGIWREVPKKIRDCLHFTIDQSDKYPKSICADCAYKLDMHYEFLLKCIESQTFLDSLSAELLKNELFDNVYIIKNELQHRDFEILELGELPDQSSIQELEHLVDEANIHADSSDITQIIQYHDGEINEEQIHDINHIGSIDPLSKDTYSLPDIALYSFDNISETDEHYLTATPFQTEHEQRFEEILNENIQQQQQSIVPIVDPIMNGSVSMVNQLQSLHHQSISESEPIQTPPLPTLPSFHQPLQTISQLPSTTTTIETLPPPAPSSLVSANTFAVPKIFDTEPIMNQQQIQPQPQHPKEQQQNTKPPSKVCATCGKSFRTAYKLTEHMRRHIIGASYKCDHYGCPKTFRSKIGLIEHQAKHTGQHKYPCEICGKGFQIKSYLATHMRTHTIGITFKCALCGLMLKTKSALINHENRHLGVKPFPCTKCDQKFVSDTLRIVHERTHDTNEFVQKYPCPICHKLFVRKSYLKTHMTIHTGNKPFVCDICGMKCLSANDLKKHNNSHKGEKDNVCEVCGKAFVRLDAFKIHMRSHTGERPYKCIYCNQQFSQVSTMKIHTRTHTGEKPYTCNMCHRNFVSLTSLRTHEKSHKSNSLNNNNNIGGSIDELQLQQQHHQQQQQQQQRLEQEQQQQLEQELQIQQHQHELQEDLLQDHHHHHHLDHPTLITDTDDLGHGGVCSVIGFPDLLVSC